MAGRRLLGCCLAVAGLGLCAPSVAQEYCSEPVEPYCVSTESDFETQVQVNRCSADLDDYEEQVNEYEKCIAGQIEGLRKELSEARSKLEEADKNL